MRVQFAPAALAVAFAVAASSLALGFDLIDDEGYITFLGALVLRDAPAAGFFFQKFHPSLSLLYAPVASLGWRAFLVAHSLVGALGVYLVGAVASRLGGSGAVASAVLALSPVYLLSAASGQSNSDGFVLLLLALWLAGLRDRREAHVLAGLTLAASIWARYELALAASLLGLSLALDRRTRGVLVGLAVGPALYLAAGALYHHDALWWMHLPPTLPRALPGTDVDALLPRTPGRVLVAAAQLSLASVVWLLPLGRASSARSPEAGRLQVAFLITLAAMVVVPFLRVLNFEHHPRYLSVILPFAAVLTSLWVATPWSFRPIAAAPSLVVLLFPERATPSLVLALLLPLAGWLPSRRARAAVVVAACVASLAISQYTSPLFQYSRAAPDTLAAARWIRERGAGREVYTNDQHLGMTLVQQGRRPPPRYLVAFDIQMEMVLLLNDRNGQREEVLRSISPRLYGDAAWVCELVRRPPTAGALFVLGSDQRIQRYFQRTFWEARTRVVATFGDIEVRELPERDGHFTPQVDAALGLTPSLQEAPCTALDDGARR